jgi:hypothetical protein
MFSRSASNPTATDPAAPDRMRFERNARIFASDGPVGVLRQVIVDEASGEITMLVVALEDGATPILVPANLIERSAGSALFLSVNRSQFARAAARAARLDMEGYRAANVKQAIKRAASSPDSRLPRLVTAGKDLVESSLPNPDGPLAERALDPIAIVPSAAVLAASAPIGDESAAPASARRLLPFRLPRSKSAAKTAAVGSAD